MTDVQIELPYTSVVLGTRYAPVGNSCALCAGLLYPNSRGDLHLALANPMGKPVVTANLLSDPQDIAPLPIWRHSLIPAICDASSCDEKSN